MKVQKNQGLVSAAYFLAISVYAVLGGGCATPIPSDTMVPENFVAERQHPFSVSVEVIGGRETHPLVAAQISSEGFAEALRASIIKSGVFQRVLKAEDTDYLLDVTILNIVEPIVALDTTFTMTTKWELSKVGVYKVIWKDLISSSYKVTLSKAFLGIKRLELAKQGAARENIKEGIRRLSLVDF